MDAAWKKGRLQDLATIVMGNSPPSSTYNALGDGAPLVNGPTEFTDTSPIAQQWTTAPQRFCERGDILLCVRGSSTGRINIADQEYCIGRGVAAVRSLRGPNGNGYLKHLLNWLVQRILKVSAGSTFPSIDKSSLLTLEVDIPSTDEQTLIADRLSCWDRVIDLVESLIRANELRMHAILPEALASSEDIWQSRKLGELFKNRKKKGSDGLPTYSVTMDKGLVLRDALERKNDTSLRPEEHLLIEKDDIAYNMMRMWQGASGLASESGLVSPAYVVLRSHGDVDPLFASYWFKTPRVIKKFQDYSHGLTKDRLRLYYKDFASIALPVPPLELQRQIARTLAACDRELDLLRRKLDLLKQQKQGLMQQLLTGKVRVKVPEGVA